MNERGDKLVNFCFSFAEGLLGGKRASAAAFQGNWEIAEFRFCGWKVRNSKNKLNGFNACSNSTRIPPPE